MLYIQKGIPPKEMTEQVIEITKSDEWKNASKEDPMLLRSFFDGLNKQPIREMLVKEQHGLCAYCMRRIETDEKMNIEHFLPIKGYKDKVLDYGNMLGCCRGDDGNEMDGSGTLCCDAAKKDRMITIDPRNQKMMEKIRYNRDGRIYVDPKDETLQHDIDHILMLNGKLNKDGSLKCDTSTHIVMGRRTAYRKYEKYMEALDKKYRGNKSKIQSSLKKRISELESREIYPEYAGVLLYFMRRRLHE